MAQKDELLEWISVNKIIPVSESGGHDDDDLEVSKARRVSKNFSKFRNLKYHFSKIGDYKIYHFKTSFSKTCTQIITT